MVGGVFPIGFIIFIWILYQNAKATAYLNGIDEGAAQIAWTEAKDDQSGSNQIPENLGAFVIPGGHADRAEDVIPGSPGSLLARRGSMGVSQTNHTLSNQPGPSGVGRAKNQLSGISTFGKGESPQDYREPSAFSHDEPSTSSQPPRRQSLPAQWQELARYAEEHRNFIPEELEEKLRRAGYVPTDDHDALVEDLWKREYGVTPLESIRLCGL